MIFTFFPDGWVHWPTPEGKTRFGGRLSHLTFS